MVVSIPHRYDTNSYRKKRWFYEIKFQFLIGTIQTISSRADHRSDRVWFQFLIGTIQTVDTVFQIVTGYGKFQFLIGTIQTKSAIAKSVVMFVVSIPHRYDTNISRCAIDQGYDGVSIPHRYDTNTPLVFGYPRRPYAVSIPHRYDTNRSAKWFMRSISFSFNSS